MKDVARDTNKLNFHIVGFVNWEVSSQDKPNYYKSESIDGIIPSDFVFVIRVILVVCEPFD